MVAGFTAALAAAAFASDPVRAQTQNPIIYPSQGQSFEQQSMDEAQCRQWAQQQTGVNPYQVPPSYYGNPNQPPGGRILGGAARGAALGAIGGAIAGDAGKGAAIGAGVGATAGLMRNRQTRRQQAQAQQQGQAQQQMQIETFNRAFGACMQGRGYTVT